MILKTGRLSLRPLRQDDAHALFAILGDSETMRFWDRPAIERAGTASEIVASQLAAMEDGHFFYWTVWADHDAIGSVDLSSLDFGHKRGEIGFFFRRDRWGQGFAREAGNAVIGHAFGSLKLERLEARVHAANRPAKALLKRLSFQPEGRLTGHILRDGVRQDVDVFGLLSASRTKNGA
ncbi:MAG TPA: GNAT family N-acetyltransferase [Rhizomicrobium sp.]|jgi:RimJ/RimL family protein N-acetyltransferase